ncbi:glycosyltransferase [Nodularia harveyana UHCC-0300]|uniref:Glycosyltransferase n=1 Tax=Nodularia harveyana UHCC-0300 TaxID=2974287 RepID=A0ABU5U8J9_9CYAN|nr:glycosyltransferase [Nodularia harveyana]MEA5579829.1 glycosyltransferase [Nodularia harveyana UHCC-0300]
MYIVFPTLEIAPFVNGGIGQYISQVIQYLQNSEYIPLILLYGIPEIKAIQAREYFNSSSYKCEIYHINELAETHLNSEDIDHIEKTSLALAEGLKKIITDKNIVGVEWCEHGGMGFHTLQDKHFNPDSIFQNLPMWVHLHGAREIWDLTDRYPVALDVSNDYILSNYAERFCLELADAWKSPSEAVADWYTSYFGIHNHVFVSPLPYRQLAELNSHCVINQPNFPLKILCPGRIVHLKGTDIIAGACAEICQTFSEQIHVTFAGYNLATTNSKYKSYLDEVKSVIPAKFLKHFAFSGQYSAEEYLKISQESHLAIFASRVETFCLAAHELNWLGVPLILPDIPAFKSHFQHGINCYKFDGSVEGLTALLTQIIENPGMLHDIKSQPISDFDVDIFTQLIKVPQVSKVNSNYFLFTRLQEINLKPGKIYDHNFKILSGYQLKTLFLAIVWKIIKRFADKIYLSASIRIYIKGFLKKNNVLQ